MIRPDELEQLWQEPFNDSFTTTMERFVGMALVAMHEQLYRQNDLLEEIAVAIKITGGMK